MKKQRTMLGWVVMIAMVVASMACSDGSVRVTPSKNALDPVIMKFTASPLENNKVELSYEFTSNVSTAELTFSGSLVENSEAKKASVDPILLELPAPGATENTVGKYNITGVMDGTEATLTVTYFTLMLSRDDIDDINDADPEKQDEIRQSKMIERQEEAKAAINGNDNPYGYVEGTDSRTIIIKEAADPVVEDPVVAPSVTVTTTDTEISSGDVAIITWDASDMGDDAGLEGAVIEIVSSDEDKPVVNVYSNEDCKEYTTAADLLAQGTPIAADMPKPAKGCAVVAPSVNTTYSVTIDGETVGSTTIDVDDGASADLSVNIRINNMETAMVDNFDAPVAVTWTVMPENAEVTVTSTPNAICNPELPVSQVMEGGQGTASCIISENTVFVVDVAISGSADRKQDTAEVVKRSPIAPAHVSIDVQTSSSWAFQGEEVELSFAASENVDPADIVSIMLVKGVKEESVKLGDVKTVKVPRDGISVYFIDSAGVTHNKGTVVRGVAMQNMGFSQPVAGIMVDSTNVDNRYVGVNAGYNGGNALVYHNGSKAIEWSFETGIKSKAGGALDGWNADRIGNKISQWPVYAMVSRPGKENEFYAAGPGLVVRSTDGGSTTEPVFATIITNSDDGYDGHNTCRGKEQTGFDGMEHEFATVRQICDLAMGQSGRLLAATDRGVVEISNIDDYMNDQANDVTLMQNYSSYGHVIDDLECLDANCDTVLSATDNGVHESKDGGRIWELYGLEGKVVYQVKKADNTVYAGTSDGLYVQVHGSNFKLMSANKQVYSIAFDPNGKDNQRMVAIGTNDGVLMSRDNMESWSELMVGSDTETAYYVTMVQKGSDLAVFMAGAKRASYGVVTVDDMTALPEEGDVTEPEDGEETDTSVEEDDVPVTPVEAE